MIDSEAALQALAGLPAGPVYLTGVSTAESKADTRPNLGALAQPDTSLHGDVADGLYGYFGADNGFYGLGTKADPTPEKIQRHTEKWTAWVRDRVAPLGERCLFVTIPDVLHWHTHPTKVNPRTGKPVRYCVGDAEATLRQYPLYAAMVRALGLTPALVLQDGLELDGEFLVAGTERVAWSQVDSVFVGGSDEFKLGAQAEAICREARRRGLWVHVGRVNSWKRIAIVRDYADSVDGTYLQFGPSKNWPKLAEWLDKLRQPHQPTLAPVVAESPSECRLCGFQMRSGQSQCRSREACTRRQS